MSIPTDEMYIAQAAVLVPIARALEKAIGKKEAHKLMSEALRDHFYKFGHDFFGQVQPGNHHFGNRMKAFADAWLVGTEFDLEHEAATETDSRFNIRRCKIAECYKGLDAPDLGYLFACGQDYPVNEGMGQNTVLERPQTMMEGASHCKFHWYVKRDEETAKQKRQLEMDGQDARLAKIQEKQTGNR
jgi:hypothetical protein